MIVGQIHEGSGLGNQLFRYVMTRTIAADLGVPFGFQGRENFKGYDFMTLDFGMTPAWLKHQFQELRKDNENGVDIRGVDPAVKQIQDHTLIDGEFQAEVYWEHRRFEIDLWLAVEPMNMPPELCIINFRGGEYKGVEDLYLPQSYWDRAISEMKAKGVTRFIVCTDDVEEATKFFPHFEVTHDMGRDWRMIRYAKHLILSNSSFAILPAWLNQKADIIAPKWWARHNKGFWALPQNEYKNWSYIE